MLVLLIIVFKFRDMDKKLLVKKIKNIGNIYKIKELVFIKRGDKYCIANGEELYLNRSFIIGCNVIILGVYKDKELLTASFFHELGHIIKSKNGNVNSEIDAWLIGFKLAKKHGFIFKEKTYLWAMKQLASYIK